MAMLAALLACGVLQDPDTTKVTLEVQDTPLGQVLDLLRTSTKIPIELDEAAKKLVDVDKELLSATLKDLPLSAALKLLLGPRRLDVKVVDKKKVVVSVAKKE